ncbi:MAG: GntR family transcriptional regulator [Bacillota bacterium]|nr:MAG: GntR family transcriptional regulator [Bacillota bacterium]
MNLSISNKGEKPIYEQLYEQISAQILNGELKADECLPSIRVISKELGISVITVKKAYELLEFHRFIYTRAGKGCFVAEHAEHKRNEKRLSLAEERLKEQLPYFQGLQLSKEELIALVDKLY